MSTKKSKKLVDQVGVLSKKHMLELVNAMKKHHYATPFLTPVDPSEAPGYLDVVDHPMDLNTIEKSVKSGKVYVDGDETGEFSSGSTQFVKDMR